MDARLPGKLDRLLPTRSLAPARQQPGPRIQHGLSWSPSVGAARTEDTVIVDSRGYEVVTGMQDWPAIEVAVKGYIIPRPGILER